MSLGVRHLAERRKKKTRRKGYGAHIATIKEGIDLLIYPVAIGAPLALVPQVLQLYKTQDVSSFALSTWLILALLNLVWLLYGAIHREPPIIVTNLLLATLNFAVVFGILLFR